MSLLAKVSHKPQPPSSHSQSSSSPSSFNCNAIFISNSKWNPKHSNASLVGNKSLEHKCAEYSQQHEEWACLRCWRATNKTSIRATFRNISWEREVSPLSGCKNNIYSVGCPSQTCFLKNQNSQPIPVVFGGCLEEPQKDF